MFWIDFVEFSEPNSLVERILVVFFDYQETTGNMSKRLAVGVGFSPTFGFFYVSLLLLKSAVVLLLWDK